MVQKTSVHENVVSNLKTMSKMFRFGLRPYRIVRDKRWTKKHSKYQGYPFPPKAVITWQHVRHTTTKSARKFSIVTIFVVHHFFDSASFSYCFLSLKLGGGGSLPCFAGVTRGNVHVRVRCLLLILNGRSLHELRHDTDTKMAPLRGFDTTAFPDTASSSAVVCFCPIMFRKPNRHD